MEEEKEAEKDDAADVEPIEVGDKMKVVKGATLRETKELDSEQLGALPKGSVIEVLEVVVLESGRTRVRCSKGWTSVTGKSGSDLLEKTDADAVEHFVEAVVEKEEAAPASPAPAPEKKSLRRRMSISSKPATVTAEMLGGIKQYEVKRSGKKMQLQVGVSIFAARNKNVQKGMCFVYSVRSPHRTTKPSRGRLRVVSPKTPTDLSAKQTHARGVTTKNVNLDRGCRPRNKPAVVIPLQPPWSVGAAHTKTSE